MQIRVVLTKVIMPTMLATMMMLPPLSNRSICCPAAWAVKSTPFKFTSKTYKTYVSLT